MYLLYNPNLKIYFKYLGNFKDLKNLHTHVNVHMCKRSIYFVNCFAEAIKAFFKDIKVAFKANVFLEQTVCWILRLRWAQGHSHHFLSYHYHSSSGFAFTRIRVNT